MQRPSLCAAPVAGMLRPPGADSINRRGTVEVPSVGPLGQPTPLTGRLTRAPTGRLAAVALVVRIAHIGMEQFTAVQALASSSSFHLGSPPSYPKHCQRMPSAPKSAAAEEDAEEHADMEEKEIEKREEEHGGRDPPQVHSGQ